jgi:uncharacterized protein YeaO (DUF488 family)
MAISVVRLGEPRAPDEGLRLGTVRRPPRGVKKDDYARRDFFDVWMPELAPPAELVSWALSEPFTTQRWNRYAKAYRAQMRKPAAWRLITMLAALSHQTDFSIGCYCADETKCHRSLLRELFAEAGAEFK